MSYLAGLRARRRAILAGVQTMKPLLRREPDPSIRAQNLSTLKDWMQQDKAAWSAAHAA